MTTFEMYKTILHPLYLDSFISRLVTLQFDTPSAFISNKSLLAFQHQDGSVDQVKEVFGVLFNTVAVGKQMTRLLVSDVFA